MGSALSPLLFCLALDPLLVFLNRIPRVLGVRAYMDDNQIWGSCPAGTVQWLQEIAQEVQKLHSAGLQVIQHTCCVLLPGAPYANPPSGTSSRCRAAQSFLADYPHATEAHTTFGTALTRAQVQQLAQKSAPALVIDLLRQPCKCKTKCSLLPDRPLTPDEIAGSRPTALLSIRHGIGTGGWAHGHTCLHPREQDIS